jgi:hypothetical protein
MSDILPEVRSASGFVAGYWLEPVDGQGFSIVLFETEEQAREAAPPVTSWAAPGISITDVEFRRVAAAAWRAPRGSRTRSLSSKEMQKWLTLAKRIRAAAAPAEINSQAPVVGASEIEIVASSQAVREVLTAFERWPSWNRDVKSMSVQGPIAPRTIFRWKAGPGTITSGLTNRLAETRPGPWADGGR